MRSWERLSAIGLLVAYLILGTLFALRTPVWQAPDEPAHYNYIRQLAAGAWPVMAPGDWDQDYLSQIVGSRFDPAYDVAVLTYEDWQPPLYYLLQTPVYRLAAAELLAMRLVSVALGAGVVVLAFLVARQVFGKEIWLALGAAAFVAFLPQHLSILSAVNNDSLAELIIAAGLLLLVLPWPDTPPPGRLLGLGLILGAAFLTKATAYLLMPVIAVFLLLRYWQQWRPLSRALVLVFAPALLLGGLWWGRNAIVYDGLDILAREAHDTVVVGQPRTSEWVAEYGLGSTVARFIRTTFNSFWGQFGWMAAPLPGWIYGPLLGLTLIAAAGLLAAAISHWRKREPNTRPVGPAVARWGLTDHQLQIGVLGLAALLTVGLHVGYNLTFVQHQGRYLFPALIPIAIGFAAGLGYWLRPLVSRWPAAGLLLPLGLAFGLGGIALFALWQILPGLAPA